jgi:hypothetical protein
MINSFDLPNTQRILKIESISLVEAFNSAYFAISPMKSKCLEFQEGTPGSDFDGSCLIQQLNPDKEKQYFELRVSPSVSYLKIWANNSQSLIGETCQRITSIFQKIKGLGLEKRKLISHIIKYKRQIEHLLTDLLKRVAARPTYFRVANAREGIIRVVELIDPEDTDIKSQFQDFSLQFSLAIERITSKQDDVTPYSDEDVRSIGVIYLKTKEYMHEYVNKLLDFDQAVRI